MPQPSFPSNVFLWPMLAAASASEFAAEMMHRMVAAAAGADEPAAAPPAWTSPNRLRLDLPTMLLRDFAMGEGGPPTLVCAPFALHHATIADFAPGHSVVEALRAHGRRNVLVTEWKSATPDMRYFSIDTYLADLNVAVDDLGAPADLVGLCQGGWLALMYAARFPAKVRRLVLVGSPVDIAAGESRLSQLAAGMPMAMVHELLHLGRGRVLGPMALALWRTEAMTDDVVCRILQIDAPALPRRLGRFRAWDSWTVNLPGTYYLEVVERIYKGNRFARGEFVALGRRLDPKAVTAPLFLLAARDDNVVATGQILAAAGLVGTPEAQVTTAIASSDHVGLFMGARTVSDHWPAIALWLDAAIPDSDASRHEVLCG
jgi:poly(3-hydroxyalkanoate) synthetase